MKTLIFTPIDRPPDEYALKVMQRDLSIEAHMHGTSVTKFETNVDLTMGTDETPRGDDIPAAVVRASSTQKQEERVFHMEDYDAQSEVEGFGLPKVYAFAT